MYIDGFINGLSFLLSFALIGELIAYWNTKKDLSFKVSLVIIRIVKAAIYVFFTIIIFLVSFFKIKYLGTAIVVGMISSGLLIYTLFDVFYYQNVKDDYIMALQNQLCEKDGLYRLFEVIENHGDKYAIKKDDERQTYGIIETEKYGKCITRDKQDVILKPKEPMNDKYLSFYAKCLEIDKDNIPAFNNKETFQKYLQSYQFVGPSIVFYWIKKRERKFKIIFMCIFITILLAFVIIVFLSEKNILGLGDWLSQEIN